jgi:hypothetical protein
LVLTAAMLTFVEPLGDEVLRWCLEARAVRCGQAQPALAHFGLEVDVGSR